MKSFIILSGLAVLLSSAVMADPGRMGGHGDHIAAAATACAGQTVGAAVTLTSPDGVRSTAATCRLMAVPNPPAEAVTACNGKASGDAVTFTHTQNSMSRTVTGTCTVLFDQLVAVPTKGVKPAMSSATGTRSATVHMGRR